MKDLSIKFQLIILIMLCSFWAFSQSPIGPFMQGKSKKSFVLSNYSETYNRLYNTKDEANTQKLTSVKSSSYNLFTTIGLSNKLDFQFNLAYAKASGEITKEVIDKANGNNDKEGIQDLSLYAKYLFKEIKNKNSSLSLIGASGFSFPIGNYKVERELESVVSIGSRSNQFTNLFVANYKLNSGLFIIGTGGYSIRGNAVPNALISETKFGFAGSFIYFDVFYSNQYSSNENSINSNSGQPIFQVNNVNFSKIGLNVYFPIIKKVGLAGGVNRYVSGLSKNEIGGYGALILNL